MLHIDEKTGAFDQQNLQSSLVPKDGLLHALHFSFSPPHDIGVRKFDTSLTVNSVITSMQRMGYEIADIKLACLTPIGLSNVIVMYR